MSTLFVDTINEQTTGNGVKIPGHVIGHKIFTIATTSTTSTSYTYAVASETYTPKFADSKIILMYDIGGWSDTDNDSQGNNNGKLDLTYSLDNGSNYTRAFEVEIPGRGGNGHAGQCIVEVSLSSTLNVKVRVGVKANDGGGRSILMRNDLGGSNQVLLMEIAQ